MPQMPGNTARPSFAIEYDQYQNASMSNRRNLMLALLTKPTLREVFESQNIGKKFEHAHLERHFYGDKNKYDYDDGKRGGYWPGNQWGYLGNKEEILRQAHIESIRAAEGLTREQVTVEGVEKAIPDTKDPVTLPIETHWVCAGCYFELVVHTGSYQVSTIILTPALPDLADDEKDDLELEGPVWTVGHQDQLAIHLAYYKESGKNKPTIDPVYPVAGQKPDPYVRIINKRREGMID